MTKTHGIIVSAMNLETNQYDGKTLPAVLNDIEGVTPPLADQKVAIVDQGYRGRRRIETTEIISVDKLRGHLNQYQKRKTRQPAQAGRAAIEPIIGHLKSDFRLVKVTSNVRKRI